MEISNHTALSEGIPESHMTTNTAPETKAPHWLHYVSLGVAIFIATIVYEQSPAWLPTADDKTASLRIVVSAIATGVAYCLAFFIGLQIAKPRRKK